MNFKITVLFLGLLFVLSVSSASAMDLEDIAIDNAVGETIVIDHDVSIAPDNQSVISATNKNTIFNVSSNATLSLSNVNLTGGKGVYGGAIYNDGVLILNNCIFINNEATYGGAIYNNGVLILNNCTFINNKATYGGGAIYNNGSMALDNCTFQSNLVSNRNSNLNSGGAIYNLQDNLTIKNSIFIENYAQIRDGELHGGAIANYGNNLVIDNCYFAGNHVFNTYWYHNGMMYGGAVYNTGDNLIVKNSRFYGNYIYGYTDSNNKHVDLSSKYGAAVFSNGGSSTFINNVFDSNEIYAMLSSYSSTKVNLSNKGISSAIVAYNEVTVVNNTFVNNSAASPPVYITKGNGCIILNNLFINNNARSLAQSISVTGNNVVIRGNEFYRNENATDKGYFEDWEVYDVVIGGVNYTVSYNYFENSYGIHYLNSMSDKTGNVTIRNNIFNNSRNSIYLEHVNNVDVDSNIFINSTHAIKTYTGRHINIKNNYFYGGGSDNATTEGYLDINSHFTTISGNVFRKLGNENSLGPVIYIKVRDNITIEGNSFTENTVGNGMGIISSIFGGYYYIDGVTDESGPLGIVDVKHNYFGNNSLNDGAIFELTASKINIEQNIIENNNGLIILSKDTYYTSQYVNFTKNQIKDFNGDIWDYSSFYNTDNLIKYDNNEKYTGDSSSFLDKIAGFLQDLRDQYFNAGNSSKDPDETDDNKNITNSSSEIPKDKTDDNKNITNSSSEIPKSESIDSAIVSDIGGMIATSASQQAMDNPSQSQPSGADASSSPSESSSKGYEIKKSSASKDISDNSSLIGAAVVFVAILGCLAYGYKRR